MASSSEYSAFISYSHADRALAKWLQSALERYRLPKAVRNEHRLPGKLRPVFLDESDLGAAPNLGKGIEDALEAAETLIVICSPAAQHSRWVQAEVAFFRGLGRSEKVILVLADGTPEESFPLDILNETSGETDLSGPERADIPLAADARPGPDSVRVRRNRVRLAVVAAILGLQPDELIRRHHQRQVRTLFALSMLSLGIAAVMIGLAIVAVTQRDRARSEERRAQEQLIESKLQQGGALIGAERWQEGLAAFDRARSLMQELGMPRLPLALKMVEAEQRTLLPYRYIELAGVAAVATSYDGSRLAVLAEKAIHVFDVKLDRKIATLHTDESAVDAFAFSDDGSMVATANGERLRLLAVADGESIAPGDATDSDITAVDFGFAVPRVFFSDTAGRVHAWNLETGQLTVIAERASPVTDIRVAKNDDRLAVAWRDGTTIVCRLVESSCTDNVDFDAGDVSSVALSEDGRWLATGDGQFLRMWDAGTGVFRSESPLGTTHVEFIGDVVVASELEGDVTAFDATSGLQMARFPAPPTLAKTQVAFSRERLALFASYDNGVLYWQMQFDPYPGNGGSITLQEPAMIDALAISADGSLIATGDDAGRIQVWDGYDLKSLATIDAHAGNVAALVFSGNGHHLISAGEDGRAVAWNLLTRQPEMQFSAVSGTLSAVALTQDGSQLAVGNEAGQVVLLQPETGARISSPPALDAQITSLGFNADNSWLAIGTAAGEFHIWHQREQRLRLITETDSDLGHLRIATRGRDQALVVRGHAELWEVEPGQRLRGFGSRLTETFNAGLLGPDLVYTGGIENLTVFDIDSTSEVATIDTQTPLLLDGRATGDGRVFAAIGFSDAQIFRWEEALTRAELRSRLETLGPDTEGANISGRVELLAQWYLAHGLKRLATRYLNRREFRGENISSLSMSQILLADGQVEDGMQYLDKAVTEGLITETYAALLRQAIQN
ncbi:MAG: TIR domain-containing protein [Chromatiales bacterium]|jgi:WD40 repeat protein